MFCTNCGKPVPSGAAFCPACGAPVTGAAEGLDPQGTPSGTETVAATPNLPSDESADLDLTVVRPRHQTVAPGAAFLQTDPAAGFTTCASCGILLSPTETASGACTSCGAAVVTPPPPTAVSAPTEDDTNLVQEPSPPTQTTSTGQACEQCGTELEPGAAKCSSCNTPTGNEPLPPVSHASGKEPRSYRMLLVAGVAAVAVCLVAAGGWFVWQQLGGDAANSASPSTTAPPDQGSGTDTSPSTTTTAAPTTTLSPTTTAPPFGASGSTVGVMESQSGVWTLLLTDGTENEFAFGADDDTPIAGDWDCDGVDTPGVWRSSTNEIFLRNSNSAGPTDVAYEYTESDVVPLAADFDGDGCDTVSFYDPADGTVAIFNTAEAAVVGKKDVADADVSYVFGDAGDQPFAGDWDGDDAATIGLFRPSTTTVYLKNSHTAGPADVDFQFGKDGDFPLAGDWGPPDGIDTVAMYTPNARTYSFRYTNSGGPADDTLQFGTRTAIPVAGVFGDTPSN